MTPRSARSTPTGSRSSRTGRGRSTHASSIGYWFHELLNAVGTAVVSAPSSPPRPYDLRHAHVIETINRWVRAGRDPEVLVTYLSLHLGHTNPDDTWYYFHLAADFHPDLRALANTDVESILPEACHGIG
jgi:integrase/recombinase XerD